VSPHKAVAFETAAAEAGVSVTRIGQALVGAESPRFVGRGGAAVSFERGAFSHF
jgi:hypothetical protein